MIAIRLAALGALTIALWGQAKPKDVAGWDKITWSMTMAEARAAYGVAAEPEVQDDWTLLDLHPVRLAGVEMGVQVGAKQGTPAIRSVRLWSYFGLPTSAPGSGSQDFDTLRSALIQKYGQPEHEETARGENFRLLKNVRWQFPSTSIVLRLEQSYSIPNLGNIVLDYTAARK